MTQQIETQPVITAKIVEHFRWIDYADIVGVTFERNGELLGGMINLNKSDLEGSFEQDWKRYTTSNATIVYDPSKQDAKGNKIVDHVKWGAFSDLEKDQAWAAIQSAFNAT